MVILTDTGCHSVSGLRGTFPISTPPYMLGKSYSHGRLPLLHQGCGEAEPHRAAACGRRGSKERQRERGVTCFSKARPGDLLLPGG